MQMAVRLITIHLLISSLDCTLHTAMNHIMTILERQSIL